MCVYIYTHTHTCIHTCIYIYIYTYMHTWMNEVHGMMFRVNGAAIFSRGANLVPMEDAVLD